MTVPAAIERGPETGASDTPGPSRAHHLRSRRAKQSGSPTGLIYQRLSLSPTGGSGNFRAPCPSASAASAAPPPRSILSEWEIRTLALSLLPKHNLLTEGGHGPPPSLARQQCLEDRRRREVPSDFHDEITARTRPRRTELQSMLHRIHARITVVATRGRFLLDSVQVFAKAPVPGEHRRHPVDLQGPSLTGGPGPVQPYVPDLTASRTLSPGAPTLISRQARHLSSRARRARPSTSAPTGSTPSDRPRVRR